MAARKVLIRLVACLITDAKSAFTAITEACDVPRSLLDKVLRENYYAGTFVPRL